mmetsp:Transcript_45781/g.82573  ORF Transcript_45781/g.82573 Transcript_45781/m.82573 type:complete len:147 (-) Transcript_45781:353-793(-)
MRVAQALWVWRTFFPELGVLIVTPRFAPVIGVVPNNQVEALSAGNVVCAVSVAPQVQNGSPHLVPVGMPVHTMIWSTFAAAKNKPSTCKVAAQTDIEGNITVVVVYVKVRVLTLLVADKEGMMPIKLRALGRKEHGDQRLKHLLLE